MHLLAVDVALRFQRETPILQSSLLGNTILVDMSAIRFCVVRVTDRTVCGQCDHELASLVYIVACLTCMCELMCVRIFFKGGLSFELKCATQSFYHNEPWCQRCGDVQWLALLRASDSRYELVRHISNMYALKCMLSVIHLLITSKVFDCNENTSVVIYIQ